MSTTSAAKSGDSLRAVRAVAVVAALALLAAGCSDGPDRLSKAEFIRRGDALCRTWNGQSGELLAVVSEEGAEGIETLADTAAVLREVATLLRAHVARLDGLVAPKEAEDAFEVARQRLRRGADAIAATADAAVAGDEETVTRRFESYLKAADAVGLWASRYGFRSCGRRPSLEPREAAEAIGPPMDGATLRAYCAELRGLADAVVSLPRDDPDALRRRLRELETAAADLADGPPPNVGSALFALRTTLQSVRKEVAERDYDLSRFGAEDGDPLAPLGAARGALLARAFALGGCAAS